MPRPFVFRITPLLLTALLLLFQYQIWTGRGSVAQVADMRVQLAQQQARNAQLQDDIARLRADLQDLNEGMFIVEDRARYEFGMVKPGEVFVQILQQ